MSITIRSITGTLLWLIYSIAGLLLLSCKQIDGEHFILPDQYEGPVIVVFSQKDGQAKRYDGSGYRIYEVAGNGVLVTQFETREGEIPQRFFYQKATGEQRLRTNGFFDSDGFVLEDLNNPDSIPPNAIFVSDGSSSLFNHTYSTEFFIARSKNALKKIREEYYAPRFDTAGHPIRSKIEELYNQVYNTIDK